MRPLVIGLVAILIVVCGVIVWASTPITCDKCAGTGKITKACETCVGTGKATKACEACVGTGKITKICETCAGVGTVSRDLRYQVISTKAEEGWEGIPFFSNWVARLTVSVRNTDDKAGYVEVTGTATGGGKTLSATARKNIAAGAVENISFTLVIDRGVKYDYTYKVIPEKISVTCPTCAGLKTVATACPTCGGAGTVKVACPTCGGTGTVKVACPKCGGTGKVKPFG